MIPALMARPLGRAITIVAIGEDAQVARASGICVGSWSGTRDGVGTSYDFSRTGAAYFADIQCCGSADQFQSITRIILCADLSGLSGSVTGGKLRVRVTGKTETLASQSVVLTDVTPDDPSLLVYQDYDNVGASIYSAAVALASVTTNASMDFTLTATAITAVNAAIGSGYFNSAFRIEADRADSAPTWTSGQKAQFDIASRNNATAAYRPSLLLW